jgi:hypothetical protein
MRIATRVIRFIVTGIIRVWVIRVISFELVRDTCIGVIRVIRVMRVVRVTSVATIAHS